MSTQPLDLSAGLQPANPPPAQGGGIDLSAGLQPAPAPAPRGDDAPGLRGMANRLMDPIEGLGEGVLDTVATAAQGMHDLGEKIHPGLGEYGASQDSINQVRAMAKPDNQAQGVFKGAENVAEFASLDGIAKHMMADTALAGLTKAEKYSKVASAMAKVEKSPTMLRILGREVAQPETIGQIARQAAGTVAVTGVRQGVVGAAQALAHGGSGSDAVHAGLAAGATGGILEGVGQGISDTYGMIKPGTNAVGGVEYKELASQRPGGSKIGGSTAANTPDVAASQQAAGEKVYLDSAQQATRDSIARGNAIKGAVKPAPEAAGAPKQTFELRTSDPKAPLQNYISDAAPASGTPKAGISAIRTQDPAEAQKWLSRLNEADEGGALDANGKQMRDELQQQLEMHHAADPARYTDPDAVASQVRSHGEAADQIRAANKPTFQKLDELSGGDFSRIQRALKSGQNKLFKAGTDEASAEAGGVIDDAKADMEKLFQQHAGSIDPKELQAARAGWHDAADLDTIHGVTESQFNGISPQTMADAAKQGKSLPRSLSDPSTKRLGKLEQTVGLPRLKQLLGEKGMVNLQSVNQLLEDKPTRSKGFQYLMHTAHYAGRGGAGALVGAAAAKATGKDPIQGGAAGFLVGAGGRAVLRQMATNPNMGKLFTYAVKNGVDPKIAIPLIAGSMAHAAGPDQMSTGATTDDAADGVAPN